MPAAQPPLSQANPLTIQQAWSRPLFAEPKGLCLSREPGSLLAWDAAGWLTLFDHAGQRQAQRQFPDLVTACAADDGSAHVAATRDGKLHWLAPDLSTRAEARAAQSPVALALDPFGRYVAVADARGGLRVFDSAGKDVSQTDVPRPLHYLAFVPAEPRLVGAADFGLVVALTLDGTTVWRDGIVANIGGLAVDGAGRSLMLACFSEGLHRYSADGKRQSPLATGEPARLVSQSFDGGRILVANMGGGLTLLNNRGQRLAGYEAAQSPVALALGPLGKQAYVALARGPVVRLDIGPAAS